VRFVLLALVIGALFPTNAWDVPVYAAIGAASLLLASAGRPWPWRFATGLGGTLLLGLLAYGLYWPFHAHYVAPFGSVARVLQPSSFDQAASHLGGLAAIVLIGLVVALLPRSEKVPWPLRLPSAAVLVVVFLLALPEIDRGWLAEGRMGSLLMPGASAALVVGTLVAAAIWAALERATLAGRVRTGGRILVVGLWAVVVAIAFAGWPVLAVFGTLAGGGLALWALGRDQGSRFGGVLVLAAGGVAAGTELVVVADDLFGGDWYRMNTVFKFYNQIWVLLALSGAALVAKLVAEADWRSARVGSGPRSETAAIEGGGRGDAGRARFALARAMRGTPRMGWARLGLAVTAVIVACSLLYPLTATGPRLRQRFVPELGGSTLNALDWMRYGSLPSAASSEPGSIGSADRITFAEDRAVIDWFNREVPGSPVVAEASIGPYRCNGSRISIGTGLPTIIGWERHLQQQRVGADLGGRVRDVDLLYRSTDPDVKANILRRYGVAYVVVGDLERRYPIADDTCAATGSTAGIATLADMIGSTLEIAFQAGETIVYRVLPSPSGP